MPPPVSPVSTSQTEVINTQIDHTSTFEDSTVMDYDTYMLNRRPGSTSDASAMNTNRYGVEVNLNSAACKTVPQDNDFRSNFVIYLHTCIL